MKSFFCWLVWNLGAFINQQSSKIPRPSVKATNYFTLSWQQNQFISSFDLKYETKWLAKLWINESFMLEAGVPFFMTTAYFFMITSFHCNLLLLKIYVISNFYSKIFVVNKVDDQWWLISVIFLLCLVLLILAIKTPFVVPNIVCNPDLIWNGSLR